MMHKRHTDLKFLKENTLGNSAYIAELIELFLSTTPLMVADLKRCYKTNDWNALRKVAHKLKSNLHTMGIEETYSSIAKLETLPENDIEIEKIGLLVEKIDKVVELSYQELNEELKTLKKK